VLPFIPNRKREAMTKPYIDGWRMTSFPFDLWNGLFNKTECEDIARKDGIGTFKL